MIRVLQHIRQRLSLRLGLLIVVIVAGAFMLLFGFLFERGKGYVQRAAIERATQLLDNTAERINSIMDETETVTNFMAQTTPQHLHPDSLLAFTRRTVAENDFLTGFAISMEPNFFPEMGRYFSAYSLRHRPDTADAPAATVAGETPTLTDSITTVREGPFEYFESVWYATPRRLGAPCWVDAFDDYNEGTLSCPDIMSSYCCPMRDANGRYLGSITASLTLKWLSQMVTAIPAYPNSSAIMVGRDGTYLVHPDTAKLYRETIFSDPDPRAATQIRAMGRAMLAGRSGMIETIVDDAPAFIFYRPVERTGWSIAIVCPASDVYVRYNRLVGIVWVIIAVGLTLLMLVCYQTVRHAAQPLKQLDHAVRRIADGHFDEPLPESQRRDSVGRLTNSFSTMQQSLAASVADIRRVNDELQQQNDELARAYQMKLEANHKKYVFIQDMYHQIRTPLNIISGFAQVLTASCHDLPEEEVKDITSRMATSADDITRLTRELKEVASNMQKQEGNINQ